MARVPMTMRLVMAEIGDEARARICDSSASVHSDLSDLVNSFIESDNGVQTGNEDDDGVNSVEHGNIIHDDLLYTEAEGRLTSLLRSGDDGDMKRMIIMETEKVCRIMEMESSSPEFKRRVMAELREAGLDAGHCKSRWDKTNRIPAGTYEYIDIHVGKNRYILEILLAGEFTIARPTNEYTNLMRHIPTIFVGEVNDLKQVVKLMCGAMRASMRNMDMHIPPWRKNRYMQAKWFSPYKRTINAISVQKGVEYNESFFERRRVGFKILETCRDDFDGGEISHLNTSLIRGVGVPL